MYSKFLELINQRKITAYKVAKATGISVSTFSDWKSGRSEPKIYKLKLIADYFGVTVDYFIGQSNEKEGK